MCFLQVCEARLLSSSNRLPDWHPTYVQGQRLASEDRVHWRKTFCMENYLCKNSYRASWFRWLFAKRSIHILDYSESVHFQNVSISINGENQYGEWSRLWGIVQQKAVFTKPPSPTFQPPPPPPPHFNASSENVKTRHNWSVWMLHDPTSPLIRSHVHGNHGKNCYTQSFQVTLSS